MSDSNPPIPDLSKLEIPEAFKEQDVFRLVIRGHAAIEEKIDITIQEAFNGSTPPELRRLPFKARLALFCALTGIPTRVVAPINALASLRHDFAHGRLDTLSRERIQGVVVDFADVFPKSSERLAVLPDPIEVLRLCLVSADEIINAAGDVARARREREKKALDFEKAVKKLLVEQKKLLAEHAPTPPG